MVVVIVVRPTQWIFLISSTLSPCLGVLKRACVPIIQNSRNSFSILDCLFHLFYSLKLNKYILNVILYIYLFSSKTVVLKKLNEFNFNWDVFIGPLSGRKPTRWQEAGSRIHDQTYLCFKREKKNSLVPHERRKIK